MNHRLKAYLLLSTTAVIWGIASPVIKYTLGFIDPLGFLFWRFLLTSLIFLPILVIYQHYRKPNLAFKDLLKLGGLGFLGTTFSLGLLFWGYKYTTAIDGSLIYSVAPIFVVIGGGVLLKEKVTPREKLGSLVACLGSIVTVIQPILEGKALAVANIYGNLLILLSALSWAGYCLIMRKLAVKEEADPLILTGVSFLAGLITITPLFLINHSFSFSNWPALPGILYMSLFSSVIAYFTYNLGYSLIEASEAALFDYLKPVFAAPVAVLWLGERLSPPFLAGAVLIFLGVLLTEWRGS